MTDKNPCPFCKSYARFLHKGTVWCAQCCLVKWLPDDKSK